MNHEVPIFTDSDSTAIHEAGHAVLAVAFDRNLLSVSLISDATGDGAVHRKRLFGTDAQCIEEIAISLVGEIAAEHYGFQTNGCHDEKQVRAILRKCFPSCDAASLRGRVHSAITEEIADFLGAITALAEAIRAPRMLSGSTATAIIKHSLPPKSNLRSRLHEIALSAKSA
jgi:hypothetical protein